ncbi:unnamed protein product [Ostreobium quekettii]|uniref:Fe2OG dioxygenase domain-containing protein n=1 Tax=Ostreobium quekettii TaxID=121088 RepID=A0A8S1IZQ5_9CHLO|nr:unnamed protein product [Ostreobium quekettii]
MFGPLRAGRLAAGRGTVGLQLLSRLFSSLPIIDVGPLVAENSDLAERQAVGAQLHIACRDVGFFYIKNHGIPESTYGKVLTEAQRWFNLPENIKEQIKITPQSHYRGYQRLGANVTRYEGGFQRDWHEGIDLYKEEDIGDVEAQGRPASPIHGRNQWPHQLPSFEAILRTYIESMLTLSAKIARGIALGLDLKEDYFDGQLAGDSYWVTRVIHYPPLSEGTQHRGEDGGITAEASDAAQGAVVDRSVQLSCGEHTDYGMLTMVNQTPDMTALQVRNAQGEWVPAAPIPGTFVCNIGDMYKVWTNGLYQPTVHRVINSHPSASRISIPFFFEPNFEATVRPLPQFCPPGEQPKHAPVRYGTHLESKVLNNFEL